MNQLRVVCYLTKSASGIRSIHLHSSTFTGSMHIKIGLLYEHSIVPGTIVLVLSRTKVLVLPVLVVASLVSTIVIIELPSISHFNANVCSMNSSYGDGSKPRLGGKHVYSLSS